MKYWKKLTAIAFAAALAASSLPATAGAVFADEANQPAVEDTTKEDAEAPAATEAADETADETKETAADTTTDGETPTTVTDLDDKDPSEVQDFPGVDAPHAGEAPKQQGHYVKSVDVSGNTKNLYSYDVVWAPGLTDGTFLCNTDYHAIVTITVYPGFKVSLPDNTWVSKSTITTPYLDSTATSYTFEKDFGKTKGHVLYKVPGTAPSSGSYGTSDYWECATCGKLFNDDVGTKEVTMDDIKGVDFMYRVYNPNSGEHFYTASAGEKDYLVNSGWKDEGIGWIAPKVSATPVYRVYNPNAGDHHYTMNKGERDYLVSIGWNDEGIGWYSDDFHTMPLYREYNPNAKTGTHNYTVNKGENDYLTSIGWNYEGLAWYARAAS